MSRGELITIPRRRAKQILVIGALWLASLLALVGWWTSVVVSQSERIVELEIASGVPRAVAEAAGERTRRMLSAPWGILRKVENLARPRSLAPRLGSSYGADSRVFP